MWTQRQEKEMLLLFLVVLVTLSSFEEMRLGLKILLWRVCVIIWIECTHFGVPFVSCCIMKRLPAVWAD